MRAATGVPTASRTRGFLFFEPRPILESFVRAFEATKISKISISTRVDWPFQIHRSKGKQMEDEIGSVDLEFPRGWGIMKRSLLEVFTIFRARVGCWNVLRNEVTFSMAPCGTMD